MDTETKKKKDISKNLQTKTNILNLTRLRKLLKTNPSFSKKEIAQT